MATTVTAKAIIDAAYTKSKKNNPGHVGTEGSELFGVVDRAVKLCYAVAARINPLYYGGSVEKVYDADAQGWPVPDELELIYGLRYREAGVIQPKPVTVVSLFEPDAETGVPRGFFEGQWFRKSPNAVRPLGAVNNVIFLGSRIPATPATVDAPLDADWPEQFNELLVLELAVHLSLKDGRLPEEVGHLKPERDRWLALYMAHVEHQVAVRRQSMAHVLRFNSSSVVPLASLFAGGTSVEVPA